MAIYYHVSTNLEHNGEFTPRIPEVRHKEKEDNITPRISVAPTMEDCFTAIPDGGCMLDGLNIKQRGMYLVYEIDTDKLGITEDDIVSTEALYESDLVRDAHVTNEVWITKSFTVPEECKFLIKLISWEESTHELVPYSTYLNVGKEDKENTDKDYIEIYGENVPYQTVIRDIQYVKENVKKGEEISIYFESESEKDLVKAFIERNYLIEIKSEFWNEVTFIPKKDSNLIDLFLYHKQIID